MLARLSGHLGRALDGERNRRLFGRALERHRHGLRFGRVCPRRGRLGAWLGRRGRGNGPDRVAGDRRRDQLAREVERLARLLRKLLARDEGPEEHADGTACHNQPRDQEPRRGADPLGLVRDGPIEEHGPVGRQGVIRQLKRHETPIVEPWHAADLGGDVVPGRRLPHDRGADEIGNAVEEDAECRLDRRRHRHDLQRRRRRLRAYLRL